MPTVIPRETFQMVMNFEGLSLLPYTCPAGRVTVGYGHVYQPTERIKPLTLTQAEALLYDDLQAAASVVNSSVKTPLNKYQFAALISFVYNIGETNFRRSTLLKKLNAGDYQGAHDQFSRWVHIDKEVNEGLRIRRETEAKLFNTYVKKETKNV